MDRNILFKAKRIDWKYLPKEKWWIEGTLIPKQLCKHSRPLIIYENKTQNIDLPALTDSEKYLTRLIAISHKKLTCMLKEVLIDEETICECTGVPDKNNKKIFENDIVKRELFDEEYIIGKVVWLDIGCCGFYLKCGNHLYSIGKDEITGISASDEIIGNIFDNSELLNQPFETDSIKTNMGKMPLEDYLEIKAYQYGFDSYAELKEAGLSISIEKNNEKKEKKETIKY